MFLKKSKIYLVMLLSLAALIAGMLLATRQPPTTLQDVSQFHGTYLPKPRTVQPFSLSGIDGKTFNNNALKGRWTLMFFGFARCSSICPVTMGELGNMYKILENNQVKQLPSVVMISLDPKRDSLETLDKYVKTFNPAFYGATGKNKALKKLANEMGIAYAKIALQEEDADNYDIQHTGTIMLFNPAGELNAFFTMPHDAMKLAEDYQRLMQG